MKLLDSIKKLFGIKKQRAKCMEATIETNNKKPVEMLRELPWLSLVNDKVFNKVVDGFECRQFPKGTTLLKRGS